MRKPFKERTFGKADALLAAVFTALAGLVCLLNLAGFAFPGESARILTEIAGVAAKPSGDCPLLRFFARLFGGGNLIAPLAGIFTVASVYALVAFFVHEHVHRSNRRPYARSASRLAGGVAATLTLFAPATLFGATHLEPKLFGVAWMLLALWPFAIWAKAGFRSADIVFPLVVGVLWGLGLVETELCWWFGPFAAWAVWATAVKRGGRPYLPLVCFALAALAAFLVLAGVATDGVLVSAVDRLRTAAAFRYQKGWMVLAAFSTLPFVLPLFAARRALDDSSGWMMWSFHLGLSFCLVLSIAVGPLSPMGLVAAPYGRALPAATSVFAAIGAGYLAAYWWLLARVARERILAYAALAVLLPVWTLASVVNLVAFDPQRGAFADVLANVCLDELGDRPYLVPYGPLADNLRLAAAKRGMPTQFLYLHRDEDRDYAAELAKGVGDADLRMSLDLGVYAFSQELMRRFPALVATAGRPGLWTAADAKAVPGFALFAGEDSSQAAQGWKDLSAWNRLAPVFEVPAGWGSRAIAAETDPLERLRLEARRHFGLMANERGVWLQDRGRDDEAYALYALALDTIDADNICALFNLLEMARAGHPKAKARLGEFERRVKLIVSDKTRRYRLRPVLDYYGRIRNFDAKPSVEPADSAATEIAEAMEALRAQKLVEARRILDAATKDHPKDLRAWSLLAAVVMQQCDAAKDAAAKAAFEKELSGSILPEMEKQADATDFYVQSVRAFLLLRQGETRRREARDAFAAAAQARPDAQAAQNALLGMDISLNDPVAAESHARMVLRRDRNMPLANYVMGSLALQKGDLEKAERYLRKGADATNGTVLAANDLAETLRRLKRFDEAERYARLTVKAAPKLYVAWDTLASILLDRGGDLDEAAACVEKACALSAVDGRPEDIRMLVSLARVQLKKGDKPRARMTLAKMRARLGELSAFERGEYDRLEADAR